MGKVPLESWQNSGFQHQQLPIKKNNMQLQYEDLGPYTYTAYDQYLQMNLNHIWLQTNQVR